MADSSLLVADDEDGAEPAIPADQIVTRAGLAKALGCHDSTIATWIDQGMPYVQRGGRGAAATGGGRWQFNLAEVKAWLEARKREREGAAGTGAVTPASLDGLETLEQAKTRRLSALADLAQLAAGERRKDLINADDAVAGWRSLIIAARSRLLAMPTRLAPELAAMDDPREIARRIEEVVYESLEELARPTGHPAVGDQSDLAVKPVPAAEARQGRARQRSGTARP